MHRPISEEGPSLLPSVVISGMSQCARKSNSGLAVVQCNRRRRGVAARWGGADRLSQPEREPIVVSDGGEAPASRSYGIKCPQGRGIHQGQKRIAEFLRDSLLQGRTAGKSLGGINLPNFPLPQKQYLKMLKFSLVLTTVSAPQCGAYGKFVLSPLLGPSFHIRS